MFNYWGCGYYEEVLGISDFQIQNSNPYITSLKNALICILRKTTYD